MFEKGNLALVPVDAAPVSWDHWYASTFDHDRMLAEGKAYSVTVNQPAVGGFGAPSFRGEVEIVNAFVAHEIMVDGWDSLTGTALTRIMSIDVQQSTESWFGGPCIVQTMTQRLQKPFTIWPAREIPANTKLQIIFGDLFAPGALLSMHVIINGTEPKLRQYPVKRGK